VPGKCIWPELREGVRAGLEFLIRIGRSTA
jgi:hypothetical protein